MSGPDVEHRTEIRRVDRTTPIWIGVAVVAVVVVLLVGSVGGGADEEEEALTPTPSTPANEALTTTPSREQPPVYGVTDSGGHVRPISTSIGSAPPSGDRDPLRLGASAPIATTGRVVVLDEGGTIHHAEPGQSFRPGVCCFDAIHPSNEPDHVWGHQGGTVGLIALDDAADPRVVLDIGDERVLGPASFGLVTVDDQGVVRWHRPSFEPAVVPIPEDRRAIDAGGERILVAVPATAEHGARLEVASITGNGLLFAHELGQSTAPEGLLAPDGSVVLVPAPGGAEVRDAATGALHGTLPKVSDPVWVGGNRFAATLDDQIVVSDSGLLPLRWPVLAVAEQSP